MPDTTNYVRFIRSGFTWDGQVRRQGHVLTSDDPIFSMPERDQRAKWGHAFFELIDAATFAVANEAPSSAPEPAERTKTPPPPGVAGEVTRGAEAPTPIPDAPTHVAASSPVAEPCPWDWYATTSADDALAKVADMPEDEAVAFLAWEQSHLARPDVLGPMTGS